MMKDGLFADLQQWSESWVQVQQAFHAWSHEYDGFDHGIGHSLLLLYDAKAPYSQKSKDFNWLVHYPFNSFYKFILN